MVSGAARAAASVAVCLHWLGGGSVVGHLSPTVQHLPASPLIITQTHSNILYGPFHHAVVGDSDRRVWVGIHSG